MPLKKPRSGLSKRLIPYRETWGTKTWEILVHFSHVCMIESNAGHQQDILEHLKTVGAFVLSSL